MLRESTGGNGSLSFGNNAIPERDRQKRRSESRNRRANLDTVKSVAPPRPVAQGCSHSRS